MTSAIVKRAKNFKDTIKAFFQNKEKKTLFLKKLFTIAFAVLIIITSGYAGLEFYFSNTISAILYLLLLLFSLSLLIYNIPYNFFKKKELVSALKNIKSFKNILVLVVFVSLLLSILISLFTPSNFNGTVRFLLIFVSALLIVSSISFEHFSKIYCYALFIICLISLGIYCVALTLYADGATNFFIESNGAIVYSYSFINFFVKIWWNYRNASSSLLRMSGPFWEPSIFAALINIGLVLIILSKKIRFKALFSIPLIISLILTFSTGGYFFVLLLIPLLLSTKIQNNKKRVIILSTYFILIVIAVLLCLGPLLPYLIELFPTIFGKFASDDPIVRFNSFSLLFEVFLDSPIFGSGIFGAQSKYISLFPPNSSDTSLTSTYGLLIAAFGIPGCLLVILIIVAPLMTKYRRMSTNLIVVAILTVLMNLQNMLMVSAATTVILFFAKEGLYGDLNLSEKPDSSKLVNKLMISQSETGTTSKNMVGLLLIKGLSMVAGIFTIPIYNSFFVTDELYGTWSVVMSILSWVLLLDFGFGSGLRAKLPDVINENDNLKKQRLISSTYIGSFVASFIIFAVITIVIWSLDLNAIMGINQAIANSFTLKISMTILGFGLALELFLKTIVFIHYGEKKSTLGASYTLISSFLLIFVFFVLQNSFDNNKLIAASIIYSVIINAPLLIGTIVYFSKKQNRPFVPSLKKFNLAICKSVMSFGIAFFLAQIGYLLISKTDSLFISSLYGPVAVSDFSKYSKVYYVLIGLMGSVVQQPVWSAISANTAKKNKKEIKKYIRLTFSAALFLFVSCLLYSIIIQLFFDVWLGSNTIAVSLNIVISMIIYSLIMLISDSLIIVANGLKILKIQAATMMSSGIIKVIVFIVIPYIPTLMSFGWQIFLIIDSICMVPLIISLCFAIFKKLKVMKEESVNAHE